mmetsp:Transcript_13515/g.26785  ORF Transcript_13515/g.26785 Transcript_13515/m.26785 type:complete len:143 (+) Transcript_13515:1086-1514(+)
MNECLHPSIHPSIQVEAACDINRSISALKFFFDRYFSLIHTYRHFIIRSKFTQRIRMHRGNKGREKREGASRAVARPPGDQEKNRKEKKGGRAMNAQIPRETKSDSERPTHQPSKQPNGRQAADWKAGTLSLSFLLYLTSQT